MTKIGRGLYRQKARKDYTSPLCRCGEPILAGQVYYEYRGYRSGVRVRHITCGIFRQSEMTSSGHLQALCGAQEAISDAMQDKDLQILEQALRDAKDTADEEADSYEESANNMGEYFPGSEKVDEIREQGQACEEWATELDTAADEIKSLAGEIEELESEREALDVDDKNYNEAVARIEGEIEEKVGEGESMAEKASGSLSV